jgi:tetratricopeptide (TPR) repeat protein
MSEYQDGLLTSALMNVDVAIAKNPNIARFYELKAWIQEASKDYDQALDSYTIVLNLQSHNPDVLFKMAELKRLQKKHLDAIQLLRKAYAQAPDRLEYLLDISENYLAISRYELALNSAQLYRSQKKKNLHPRYDKVLAVYNYYQHEYQEAVNYFTKCTNLLDFNRNEIILYLKSYNHIGNYDDFYKILIGPEREKLSPAELNMFRGIYYYQLAKYHDAGRQFNMAFDNGIADPLIYYYYGKVLIELGDNEEAVIMLKKFRSEADRPELEPRMKTDLLLKDLE